MKNYKNRMLWFTVVLLVFSGCTIDMQEAMGESGINLPITPITDSRPKTKAKQKKQQEEDSARKFIETHNLGRRITTQATFSEFLDKLPDYFSDNKESSRVYLARIDDFSIGSAYSSLDQWDMALETGFIDGLILNGLTIAEKLDHVNPRDPSEYINTSPEDAFYMHGINLDDLNLIKDDLKAPYLMTYQIMDFSKENLSVVIYVRMIDISSMKIIASTMAKVGDVVSFEAQKHISAYEDTYQTVKDIYDFPGYIFNNGATVGLMNADILNISGNYKKQPSKKSIAIENAIVSGIIQNVSYDQNEPVIMEKTEGFKLKFPSVYNSIVFNTSPVLYENWSEFVDETDCNVLMMYRYMPEEGLYIKIIDTEDNGRIIYSNAFAFKDSGYEGLIKNHTVVYELLKPQLDVSSFEGKKVMIIDGDKQAVASDEYFNNQPNFNEMNLIIEEGMISALVSEGVPLYEKLKTLYLKRPWMYDEKVFNLNPLYLDDWEQLKDFGVETIMVYNNLIPYEKLDSSHPDYEKVAIGIRIVDVDNGDILKVTDITNLN